VVGDGPELWDIGRGPGGTTVLLGQPAVAAQRFPAGGERCNAPVLQRCCVPGRCEQLELRAAGCCLRFPAGGNDVTPQGRAQQRRPRHGSRAWSSERVCRPPGSEAISWGRQRPCGAYSGADGRSGPDGAVWCSGRRAVGRSCPAGPARRAARCALRGKESLPAVKHLQVLTTYGMQRRSPAPPLRCPPWYTPPAAARSPPRRSDLEGVCTAGPRRRCTLSHLRRTRRVQRPGAGQQRRCSSEAQRRCFVARVSARASDGAG
jgi:hypothetical protein